MLTLMALSIRLHWFDWLRISFAFNVLNVNLDLGINKKA